MSRGFHVEFRVWTSPNRRPRLFAPDDALAATSSGEGSGGLTFGCAVSEGAAPRFEPLAASSYVNAPVKIVRHQADRPVGIPPGRGIIDGVSWNAGDLRVAPFRSGVRCPVAKEILPNDRSSTAGFGLLLLGALLRAAWPGCAVAAAPPKAARAEAGGERVGQFLTIDAPLTDDVVLNIRRTIDTLKTQAVQGKKAYLVLEIRKASSPFHHAYALADLLSSNATVGVTVVGWIPEKLTGSMPSWLLACHEIVMDPEARSATWGTASRCPTTSG